MPSDSTKSKIASFFKKKKDKDDIKPNRPVREKSPPLSTAGLPTFVGDQISDIEKPSLQKGVTKAIEKEMAKVSRCKLLAASPSY